MKVTLRIGTLADFYTALILANNGFEVDAIASESLIRRGGLIVCRFLEEGIFDGVSGGNNNSRYDELTSAASLLHSVSPNTVYPEVIYAVQDRNVLRDFANHFRQKAYRDISKPEEGVKVLRDGVKLRNGKVLRCAPAYRVNYERLVVSIVRTIKKLGGNLVLDNDTPHANPSVDTVYQYIRLNAEQSPTVWKSVFLPGGVWLYSRSGDFYILARKGVDVASVLNESFDGFHLPENALEGAAEISLCEDDMPFEALLTAQHSVINDYNIASAQMPVLDGSNFQFSPSMADVVGYADYYYDMVKRLDIGIGEFRDAVFDYGTNIEAIVNDTFDYFPVYHNGLKSFRAMVAKWKESEL